jgi:cysteinyl-tRNA synthetase
MVTKHLGYRIDIACGGIDNIYRHHDYNLAVIEAASGEEFSRYWVHGEHLLADGKKMSKSKGNIIYPEDLLRDGFTPQHVRFYLLYGHHRKRMNLTMGSYRKMAEKLDAFRKTVQGLLDPEGAAASRKKPQQAAPELIDGLLEDFKAYMDDDLRIQGAFDAITDGVSRLMSLKRDGRLTAAHRGKIQENLGKIDQVLQVIFP